MPIPFDYPAYAALASRWAHLTYLSLVPRITPDEVAELLAIPVLALALIPPAPPFVPLHLFDHEVPADGPPVHTTHDLFASQSLQFVWVRRGTTERVKLTSPDDTDRTYYPVTLAFYAWVRGVCRAQHRAGNWPLPDDEQRAVDRVLAYICFRHGITERSQLPEPSDDFPE